MLVICVLTSQRYYQNKQIAAIALASAMSTKSPSLIEAMTEFAGATLSEEEMTGAKIANSIMSMNNIYYRFVHLVSDSEYGKLPARLRMNAMSNPLSLHQSPYQRLTVAVCVSIHTRKTYAAWA